MLTWLIGVAIFVVLLGALCRVSPKAGFGALVGLPLAWVFSLLLTPYITGMNPIPAWLPALPLAIIALVLFVFGTIVFFRADKLPPPKRSESHDEHGHDHAHH